MSGFRNAYEFLFGFLTFSVPMPRFITVETFSLFLYFVNVDPNYTKGFDPKNSLCIAVRTSSSGSMTKDLFLDTMLHYVKYIAADQGPNGKFDFLLLDSHVSR